MPWAVILRAIFGWILVLGVSGSVDVSFDGEKDGFFLKPLYEKNKHFDPLVRRENLILTGPSDVYNLKASSGPFEVHQVIQDDLIDTFLESDEKEKYSLVHRDVIYDTDISAHIVTDKLSPKWSKLQVLIHASPHTKKKKLKSGDRRMPPRLMCGHVYARNRHIELSSICVLSDQDSACVSGIDLPQDWWHQNTTVKVFYALSHADQNQECASASNSIVPGKAFENPLTSKRKFITNLYLSKLTDEFKEVKDQHILIYVPVETLDLGTIFEIPVKLEAESDLQGFVMRAKVRHGIKITGAIAKADSPWQIHVDIHDRKKVGTVTAFLRDSSKYSKSSNVQDVFKWQMEIDNDAETTEMGRVIWSIEYEKGNNQETYTPHDSRIVSRINIRRGEQERLVPVIKTGELLNFAVLTGKEQVYPLKVFTVSENDLVVDVSHHTVCHSAEEDVLKVASDCSSLYVDGTERRGSHNVTVIAKSGHHTAFTNVKVWMPLDPLDIQITDSKLSQIRGWKVSRKSGDKNRGRSRNKRVVDFGIYTHPSVYLNKKSKKYGRSAHSCHLRYQQAEVKIYVQFYIGTPSGTDYFKGRQASLLVTDVLSNQLRVADSRIARLDGTLIQGQSQGRTEIQVLSPSGRVMAAKEIRVGNDKVTVERLVITLISGITLVIQPSYDMTGALTAVTHIQDRLYTKYQEAILDVAVQYSDGTRFPLKYVAPEDYILEVSSLDHTLIGIAPYEKPYQPRIVALGEGRAELLKVILKIGDSCIRKRSRDLDVSFVPIDADFSLENRVYHDAALRDNNYDNRASDRHDNVGILKKPSFLQPDKLRQSVHKSNNKNNKFSKKGNSDQPVIPIGIDLAENLKQETPQTQNEPLKEPAKKGLTPLEIGGYVSLAVFSVVIAVFMVHFIVYMRRHKRRREVKGSKESVSQANDWVWIGRATLERNAINTKCSQTLMPVEDFNGNHTRPSSHNSSRESSAQNSNRSSFVSTIKGSECSIRITANPLPEQDGEVENNNNPAAPEWDYEAMGMTYDELVEYFDNLKESTA